MGSLQNTWGSLLWDLGCTARGSSAVAMCWQAWEYGLSAYLALTASEFEISGVLSEPSLAAALNGNGSWQAHPYPLAWRRVQAQINKQVHDVFFSNSSVGSIPLQLSSAFD